MSDNSTLDPTRFGFAKMKYAQVERERRWLCGLATLSVCDPAQSVTIVDKYLDGTHLRLRDIMKPDGARHMTKLGRKVDMDDPRHRLITSLYLDEAERTLLQTLPGGALAKTRYTYVHGSHTMSIDIFEGALAGLILAETEFETDAAMKAFEPPAFVRREVSDDLSFSGGTLAHLTDDEARTFVAGLP